MITENSFGLTGQRSSQNYTICSGEQSIQLLWTIYLVSMSCTALGVLADSDYLHSQRLRQAGCLISDTAQANYQQGRPRDLSRRRLIP